MKVGVSIMRNYENGYRNPSDKTWQRLSQFFNVPVPYIQGTINEQSLEYKLFYDNPPKGRKPNPNKELSAILKHLSRNLDYASPELQKILSRTLLSLNDYTVMINQDYGSPTAESDFLIDLNAFLLMGTHLIGTEQYEKLEELGDAIYMAYRNGNAGDNGTSQSYRLDK